MEMYQPLLAINWWNLLFTLITVIVLFIILKVFFFEKVHKFMMNRENEIRSSIENADNVNKLADEKLQNYEAKIANVEMESRQMLKAARDEAKVQAKEIVDSANEKARNLIDHSQKEIRREQYNARKELKEEVGNLAMMAAEQILEKELSPETHEEIINKIIEEADEKPWS
ncbi:F0F1 ATP synthase subunit B [Emergencia timonensis]|uniref:F0F1 ATP synthase subunit B n=1 Tax=Emergencia timonensis TaxID=1776384 RepID=UPI003991671D